MADATSPPGTQATQGEPTEVKDKAQEMAGQAQEKAQEAAGQAQSMMREQVDQRSTQAGEKLGETAGDLRSVGEELRNKGKDAPAKFADRGAEQIERVGSYLSESDPDRLLSDMEDFGRRQPLAVLAGGLVVGIAAARFLKASSRGRYRSRSGSQAGRELPPATPPTPASSVAPEPLGATAGTPPPAPAQPVMGR